MQFNISPTTGVPIYQQLTDQICTGVARGQLRADQRLPSVRNCRSIGRQSQHRGSRLYRIGGAKAYCTHGPAWESSWRSFPSPLSKKTRRERLLSSVDRLLVDAVRFGFTADEFVELVEERIKQFRWSPTAAAST